MLADAVYNLWAITRSSTISKYAGALTKTCKRPSNKADVVISVASRSKRNPYAVYAYVDKTATAAVAYCSAWTAVTSSSDRVNGVNHNG